MDNLARAIAPSNIALIKYMGKRDPQLNLAANPSLSMTLKNLCTGVEIIASDSDQIFNEVPTQPAPQGFEWRSLKWSSSASEKVLRHLNRLRSRLRGFGAPWELRFETIRQLAIRSANTFPEASGIASSASAFAALTLAMCEAFCEDREKFRILFSDQPDFRRALSILSREGSGSSCRSFGGPWVIWNGEGGGEIESRMPVLRDFVLIADSSAKEVPSSEAHRRVYTSPVMKVREQELPARFSAMSGAIHQGDLETVSDLSWLEFQQMHELFHTSQPAFSYWKERTRELLGWAEEFHQKERNWIFTMDAGANLHVLVPESDSSGFRKKILSEWEGKIQVLEDGSSGGAYLCPRLC